jgi:hypothetical protein
MTVPYGEVCTLTDAKRRRLSKNSPLIVAGPKALLRKLVVEPYARDIGRQLIADGATGCNSASARSVEVYESSVVIFIHRMKEFRANRPIRAHRELNASTDNASPTGPAAVSTRSAGNAKVAEPDAGLIEVRPRGTARHVDQGIAHHQAGPTPDRSTDINPVADRERNGISRANHRALERAVSVHVRLDADQAGAELIVVADLRAASEEAVSRRGGRAKEAGIIEVRRSNASAEVAADVETRPAIDRSLWSFGIGNSEISGHACGRR